MLISQSEWARRQGFTRQYVGRLVARGLVRLVDGKVDTVQAEAALEAIREPAREPQRKSNPVPTPAPVAVPAPPRPTRPPTPAQPPTPIVPATPSPTMPPTPPMAKPTLSLDVPGGASGDLPTLLLKARIKSEIKRASLLEIREKVETGKLVDADEMYAASFNRGRAIRAAWEAWPNRVSGPLAAELGVETRTMRLTLERYVREHLLELSGMEGENYHG